MFAELRKISSDCPIFLDLVDLSESHWFLGAAFLSKWLITALKKGLRLIFFLTFDSFCSLKSRNSRK